jgi:hypothetical protein
MTIHRWRPGEVILMEQYLSRTRHQLIDVRPQVVVHDAEDYLAVLSQPGMNFMTRDVPGRNQLSVEERIDLYIKEELNHEWYERKPSGRAVLTIYPPDAAHSIRIFWAEGWQFRMWYVNLEDPYKRTPRGIEVDDHTLDIVANRNLEWSWKDEPEFEALVSAGKIPPDKAREIRAEGERVIQQIENREWPFNEPWPDWRPDPVWPVPQIADYWRAPV